MTRAMGGEEGADYFAQGRRRYGGCDWGSGDAEASSMLMATPTGYATEQGTCQLGRSMPPSQGHRSPNLAPPSVLSPASGYGQSSFYAAGGAQHQQHQHQQAQASMSGFQAGSPGGTMPGMQLRVSTAYDGRSYGEPTVQGATGGSRLEAAPVLYHPQSMQQGGSYAYLPAP